MHRSISRSVRTLFPILALLTASVGLPGTASAGRPGDGVPPLRAEGPVVLPNGKILPVAPRGIGPSEMAVAWAEHQDDKLSFTPGARPHPLKAGGTSLSLADPSAAAGTTLIDLAPSNATAEATLAATLPNGLKKQVFGFLPYWMLGASDLQWMRYDNVSTIAYFGVAAHADGTLGTSGSTWSGWTSSAMTNVTNAAHARGDKVVLTVTMMAWDSASASKQATLLGSSSARKTLISNIVKTVTSRNADGVNLDFEPLATSLRDQYTSFVKQLKSALVTAGAPALTVCTTAGAATWSTGYDVGALTASGAADAIFVMGYDYSWSGSSRAGGVAPMSSSYMLDVNESLNDFLSETSGSRLIWGVPYYGRTWLTTSGNLNASTVSGASSQSKAYFYTGAKSLAASHGRKWDSLGQVPWFAYKNSSGQWIEGYYDDTASLGAKYDMINQRGLAGVGIWHFLMDEGVSDLWNLLANKFQKDTVPPTGGITSLPPTSDTLAIPVSWRATDVGSGVASYTVQVRDRSSSTWTTWLSNTTATSGSYAGIDGHSYEFRVSAKDKLGNAQPWVSPMGNPGSALAVGGFATVQVSSLNIRSGAGTGFTALLQLPKGERVGVLAGPVSSGGYSWYQIQFDFSEWPSADYPRTGWAAAGYGTDKYLVPAVAPTVTTLAPFVTLYSAYPLWFSPNGDGVKDGAYARYTLAGSASVRLDVLATNGSIVDSTSLGTQASGYHRASWDGHLSGGGVAPDGVYLLRVTATDANGSHLAPAAAASSQVLGTWGVHLDTRAPSVTAVSPTGSDVDPSAMVSAHFSEPVRGVTASRFTLTDVNAASGVNAQLSYDGRTRWAKLNPSADLTGGHQYRAAVSSGIQDRAGNPLVARNWTFSVASNSVTYSPAKRLVFEAGTTTGYQFDTSGNVTGHKSYTLGRASGADADRRSTAIPGHSGAWFHIVNGIWAGYWVRESSRVYLPGISEQVAFSSPHRVNFDGGTYVGVQYNSSWDVVARKPYTLSRASGADADRRAVINGVDSVHIINGIWAGYWVPLGGGAVLT